MPRQSLRVIVSVQAVGLPLSNSLLPDVALARAPLRSVNPNEAEREVARDRVDLKKLRSREKTSGRPLPIGPKNRGYGGDNAAIPLLACTGGSSSRFAENRDAGPRGHQNHNTSSLRERQEDGSGGVEYIRNFGKRPAVDSQKGNEFLHSDSLKKSREGSSFLARKSSVHLLLLDGVNRDGAESFCDSGDFEIGLKRGARIVGDHDMGHLVPRPSAVLHQSIALSSCQILSAVRALEAREEKARSDEAKLHKELARLKEDVTRLEASDAKANEEVRRLEGDNTKLAEKLVVKTKEGEDLRSELRTLNEKHYVEVQTGLGYLASSAGLELKRSLAERAVDSYRMSSAFEDEIYQCAYGIHDELILECRHIVQKNLVHEDVVQLIGPGVEDIDKDVLGVPAVDGPVPG